MISHRLLNPKFVAAILAVAMLGMGTVLLLETVSSQAHAAALAAINDPAGVVAQKIGNPKRVILAGSSSKTLTAGNVTRTCGSNRYLVFTEKQWSWVEVTLYKPENKWDWAAREVLVGWSSRPVQPC
jgi:hypothetical protein